MSLTMPHPDLPNVPVRAVWLTASPQAIRTYRSLLLPEEKARAERFAFDHLRQLYELSQGALRLLLARYLKCPAQEVAFTFGPKGKPALRGESRLRFNKTQSGSLALYAFTTDCEIGVDVEEMREAPDIDQIASHYFCRAEASELSSLGSPRAKQEAFLRCWTRKEAYIKAVGDGLYMPLDQFQVTLLPGDPARFVHIGNDERIASDWTLQHIEPARGYIGAVAYRAKPRAIDFHRAVDCNELLEAADR
ncbi:MAG: 4'-phosphopantetheinyl transferase family protein [Candidatus Acidiferrales bacterium]